MIARSGLHSRLPQHTAEEGILPACGELGSASASGGGGAVCILFARSPVRVALTSESKSLRRAHIRVSPISEAQLGSSPQRQLPHAKRPPPPPHTHTKPAPAPARTPRCGCAPRRRQSPAGRGGVRRDSGSAADGGRGWARARALAAAERARKWAQPPLGWCYQERVALGGFGHQQKVTVAVVPRRFGRLGPSHQQQPAQPRGRSLPGRLPGRSLPGRLPGEVPPGPAPGRSLPVLPRVRARIVSRRPQSAAVRPRAASDSAAHAAHGWSEPALRARAPGAGTY